MKTMNAAETSLLPKRFTASIGGYMGSSFSIELHERTIIYTTTDLHYTSPKHASIRPTDAEWKEFRHTLDDIKVWQWLNEYSNPEIRDGTSWSFDIEYPDHALTTQGDNNYPGAHGKQTDELNPTNTFDRLLRAISKLTGRSFE